MSFGSTLQYTGRAFSVSLPFSVWFYPPTHWEGIQCVYHEVMLSVFAPSAAGDLTQLF